MRLHPSVNEIEPVQWQHHAAGQEVDIEARLLTNARWLETGQPSLLMIPGYGEGEWAAQQALKYFTSIGKRATVALVDTSQTPASLEDVTTFAHDFAPQVVSQLQTRGVLPEKATVLGHSMGGGILSLGVQEAPELFGSIGLLEPIGNDTAAQILIQPDQAKRERAFKRRFARVVIGPYMHANPNELLHAGLDISRQLAKDFRPFSHRFRDKIALTAGSDGMPAVIEHAADGNAVAYVLGGKDPLVKPSMILGSIYYHFQTGELSHMSVEQAREALNNLALVPTNEKHAYMGWRSGNRHVYEALRFLGIKENLIVQQAVQNTNNGQDPQIEDNEAAS